jgi:hypothetical protein
MRGRVFTRGIYGYAGVTRLQRRTGRPMSSHRGLAPPWRAPAPALVAAVAVALAAAAPALPDNRTAAPPRIHRAHLKPLWKQFPLQQSTLRQHTAKTTTAATSTTAAPRARSEKPRHEQIATKSDTSRMWPIPAAAVLTLSVAAAAWKLTQRKRSRRSAIRSTERARGLDLLDPAPTSAPTPTRVDPPTEPAAHWRASTTVAMTRLMERHLYEGSNGMSLDARDEPTASQSPDVLRSQIASLLEAAQDAADDIRKAARQEAEDVRVEAERYGEEVRRRADVAAAEKRAAVDSEIARIVQAAEGRARQIEDSALEHRKRVAAESQALEQLLDDRRRWLREMMDAFREVTNRLEGVTTALPAADEDAASAGDDSDGRARTPEPAKSRVY